MAAAGPPQGAQLSLAPAAAPPAAESFPMMGVSATFLAQFIRQHPELAGGTVMAAMSTASQPGVTPFTP